MTEPTQPAVQPLPVTWRPFKARLVSLGLAAATIVIVSATALLIPTFEPADRVALVALSLVVGGALAVLGRCRLRADAGGLTVVNVLRTVRLDWAEVLSARMPRGEPWPTLDLADGTTIAAMGIQSTDGHVAQRQLAELQTLIEQRGEAPEPS